MALSIEFEKAYLYNMLETGITIPVILSTGYKAVNAKAKIDTGASFCVFDRSVAEDIDIDVESGNELSFSTATGTFVAFGHELTISVLGIEFESTVYFAANEGFTRNVLGRRGWLDMVKIGLIDYEGKLFLSANNEQ